MYREYYHQLSQRLRKLSRYLDLGQYFLAQIEQKTVIIVLVQYSLFYVS